MKRGFNQSSDAKYAALLLCNAIATLESGRTAKAKELMQEAVCLLPDVENIIQKKAICRREALIELRECF